MFIEIIVKPKAISDFINMLMGRYADKIVTVSQAVANHIKQSPFIKDSQVEVIYNGVDNAVYYPMDASSIREKFDIAQDSTCDWHDWSGQCYKRTKMIS